MRVLLTTDTVGGVWTFTKELTVGLLERGHSVALVSLGAVPTEQQRLWVLRVEEQYGAAFRFEASHAPLEWMEGNQFAYYDAEPLLLRVIEEFGVDIVHASQFCFGALPVKMPKVLTAHSDVLSWAEACKHGGLEESEWLSTYREIVSAGLVGADAVIAPTRWMGNALMRSFVNCGKVYSITNGRTLEAADRSEPRKLQAITIGRLWDEAKGLDVLKDVKTCMPILLAGEVCFERDRAPDLKTVQFLGRLEEDQVCEALWRSSLYLATSIYEPFGLAPLEAALCGCGVVARDIASLREVWGNAVEYFTNSQELSRLLERLGDSPAELDELRSRSMRRALELSADRMVDGYVVQYEALLARRSACEEVAAYAG